MHFRSGFLRGCVSRSAEHICSDTSSCGSGGVRCAPGSVCSPRSTMIFIGSEVLKGVRFSMCPGPLTGEAPPFVLKKGCAVRSGEPESEAEQPEAKVLWNGAEGLLLSLRMRVGGLLNCFNIPSQSQTHQHMRCFFSRRSIVACVFQHMKANRLARGQTDLQTARAQRERFPRVLHEADPSKLACMPRNQTGRHRRSRS